MEDIQKKFLNLFFNPGETICVSDNKYGYHSVSLEDVLNNDITLIPTAASQEHGQEPYRIELKDICLMAINPINGFRADANTTALRSFMIEMDNGSLKEQHDYVKSLGFPYSVCVFSGNKSLHYGIILNEDIENEFVWRFLMDWVLNIVTRADKQAKNPTRSIRFPGHKRKNGKALMQTIVEFNRRKSKDEFFNWLNLYPQCKPVIPVPKPASFTGVPSLSRIPRWIMETLEDGIFKERNATWFKVAIVFAERGFPKDEAIQILTEYFTPERDFSHKEWFRTIDSAYDKFNRSSL